MRQIARLSLASVGLILSLLWSEQPVWAATFTVNDTSDLMDDNIGDGVCHTATGTCTLRAAVQEANADPGVDVITLPSGVYVLTLTGAGEDAAATGDLDITESLTIIGAGAANTIVDGGPAGSANDRLFSIHNQIGRAHV